MAGNQNKTTAAVMAAVFFAAGMGFMVGRLTADSSEQQSSERAEVASSKRDKTASKKNLVQFDPAPDQGRGRRRDAMPSSRWAKAWRNQARLNKAQSDKDRVKTPLNEALKAAREAENSPDSEEAQSGAREAARGLYFKLSSDPTALAGALQRMPNLTDRGEIGLMAAVLARIRDPEVEELAIAMTT
ncbi:MAG: hypothetical protein P1V97_29455, partial [Planctomycetota bacterium]|nr:hypothetical protein [Planctomycetota bacterium]